MFILHFGDDCFNILWTVILINIPKGNLKNNFLINHFANYLIYLFFQIGDLIA